MLKYAILGIVILIFIIGYNINAEAVPYQYNISSFTPTWTTVPNAVALDTDSDGKSDVIYSYSSAGQNYTFTRYLGGSGGAKVITMPASYTFSSITVNKDIIFLGSYRGNINPWGFNLGMLNVTSGTVTNSVLTDSFASVNPITSGVVSGMLGRSNEPIINSIGFESIGSGDYFKSKNSTATLLTYTLNAASDFNYGNNYAFANLNASPKMITNEYKQVIRGATGDALLGHCQTSTGCMVYTSATNTASFIKPSTPLASTAKISPMIQLYQNGMALPMKKNGLVDIPAKWNNMLPTLDGSPEKIGVLLPYKLLDSTLASEPIRFIHKFGSQIAIVYATGNDVKYSEINESVFSNRAIGYYLIDINTPTFDTIATTSQLTASNIDIITPTTTYSAFSTSGIISSYSGITFKPLTTIARILEPRVSNSTSLIPYIVGPTTSQTSLNVLVKNAPQDSAIDIRDIYKLNTIDYTWNQDYLKADKSFTVDLPNAKCVNIYLKDLTTIGLPWEYLGNLCASGSMPKSIIYTANLSFTFYSLPYGVSHTYTQPTSLVTTKVRHDTLPYNYTVKIYDSSGALQYNNNFKENMTTVDTQTINTTAITKPAMLKVYDVDGNQLYYSSIGQPGYLSQTVAWFSQWLTISGFNLLFMLPIVFGAMFTRNTVGIGTMSTVVLISVLTWFGILPIPDIAIYLMIFVSVIGVIAYKKIYE